MVKQLPKTGRETLAASHDTIKATTIAMLVGQVFMQGALNKVLGLISGV